MYKKQEQALNSMMSHNPNNHLSMSFDESKYYGLSRDGVFYGQINNKNRQANAAYNEDLVTFG